MPWLSAAIDFLSARSPCGYHIDGVPASEPTALSALALVGHDRAEAAVGALEWLVDLQSPEGSVGVLADQPVPGWPTSLAILAWRHFDLAEGKTRFARHVHRGVNWLLQTHGTTFPRAPSHGHNSMLAGWPWVQGTHSWLEPTSWAVLALRSVSRNVHPRTREGIAMLKDRILPTGGGNYGNTFILGQQLRPHVQPTGLMLLALRGEPDTTGRIRKSLDYLLQAVEQPIAPASLSYALLGLAAGKQNFAGARQALAAAAKQSLERSNPLELALLSLAALDTECPLLRITA